MVNTEGTNVGTGTLYIGLQSITVCRHLPAGTEREESALVFCYMFILYKVGVFFFLRYLINNCGVLDYEDV